MCARSFLPHRRQRWAVVLSLIFGLFVIVPRAPAQSSSAASVEGKVADATAAALPGVSVTLSSPALQVSQLSTVTDADGTYRFVNLPAGVYRATYELSGFQTLVREAVRLNAGFAARLDAEMQIGAFVETLNVSGQNPVVDISTAVGSTNLTKETLQNIPNTRTLWQALAMAPGIRVTSTPDVGGNTVGTQQNYSNYGTSDQTTPEIEGIQTRENTGAAGMYHDYNSFEELLVKPVGSGPETGTPGTNFVIVVKSGGNDFHGTYTAFGQRPELQGDNVDDDLRGQGVSRGNPLKYYWDFSGDLGGRVIQDKVWFYGAYRNQRNVSERIGYAKAAGSDGVYGTADDELGESLAAVHGLTGKLTYQATKKYQMTGFFVRTLKLEPERAGSRFVPAESTMNQRSSQIATKVQVQGTPTDKVLFDFNVAVHVQNAYLGPAEDVPGKPSRFDRTTGIYTGAAPPDNSLGLSNNTRDNIRTRPQSQGSISFFPERFLGGGHSFKAGYGVIYAIHGVEQPNKENGNYVLIYDQVGGVPHRPVEISTWNLPLEGTYNRHLESFAYVKDDWRIRQHLTAQLGLRFERYHNYVVEQRKVQGIFGTSGTFPPVDVLTWNALAPRFGLAWDLTGDGRTVFKSTYGLFNHTAGDVFADDFNQNSLTRVAYRWSDPDGNDDYTPGEVNLDQNNGPDFLNVTGAANNILNRELRQPVTHEFSTALERQLIANFSARALYVYKRAHDLYAARNVLRPYRAYNIPLVRRDPGPDGRLGTADDGGNVTIFDYDSAFRGAAFVGRQFLNSEGKDDSYHTMELTLNKRLSQKWDMLTSVSATRNHRWINAIPESPNDEFFPLDETWNWQFKAIGSYRFPYDVRASAFFQHLSGNPAQRTYIFRSADPDGGAPLRQLSTVTLRLEPLGSRRQPSLNVLHVRGSKIFTLGPGRQLVIDLDVFNVLNANTASTIDFRSGPTFGLISQILPPRVARLGATISF